jgi:hypothetical protein
VLDLAGIRVPNHFTGSSLLRSKNARNRSAFCLRWEQGLLISDGFSLHGPIGHAPRVQGNELFRRENDRLEKFNVLDGHTRFYNSRLLGLRSRAGLNTYLIENNRVWP